MRATTRPVRRTLAGLPKGSPIIGSVWKYAGDFHRGLRGYQAVVLAVHRGSVDDKAILTDDESIGAIRPDDIVEFAPIIRERDGRERRSWITSDARPDELEAVR